MFRVPYPEPRSKVGGEVGGKHSAAPKLRRRQLPVARSARERGEGRTCGFLMERVSYPVGPPGGFAGVLQADGLMRNPLFHEARQATRQAMHPSRSMAWRAT